MASSDDCFDHFWDRIERYLPDTFPKTSAERKKFLTNEHFPMMIWSKIESIASERKPTMNCIRGRRLGDCKRRK
jgi:hypothetical protein